MKTKTPNDSTVTEQPTWTKEALVQRIAEGRKETCKKYGMPAWMLDGFRSGQIQGRS
jgi:hypothetical protein